MAPNETVEKARYEWRARTSIGLAIDLDSGRVLARVYFREPGCYLAEIIGGEQSTHGTEYAAYKWCDERIGGL